MKNLLCSTTALAAAGMLVLSAGSAEAAKKAKPMKMGIGGYMSIVFGVTDNQDAFEVDADQGTGTVKRESFNLVQDSEIYFRGSTKLDNGIRVDGTIQLEADAHSGGTIDESYLKFTGGFGDIRLGATKAAGAVLRATAIYTGTFRSDTPDVGLFINQPAAVTVNGNTSVIAASDAMKIVYITPKIGGFRMGATYTPSETAGSALAAIGGNSGTEVQRWDAMVQYENKMGASDVHLDIGYMEDDGPSTNALKAVRGGVRVIFGGTSIAASMMAVSDVDSGLGGTVNTHDNDSWDIGFSQKVGAYTVGAAYFHSERNVAATADDEVDKWQVGVSTAIGPGVTLTGSVHRAEYDDSGIAVANNNKGWAAIAGLRVGF